VNDTILCNRYRLNNVLGRGGSAIVHRAFDEKLKRDVAVKLLDPNRTTDAFLTRFKNESEWMAGFSHPNIVTIFDAGEHQGAPFLVMELVTGKALLDIAPPSPLPAERVCTLLLPVCKAMAYSHERDILHRDLTLKNIMVEDPTVELPVVKVLDFGLAKLLNSDFQTTAHLLGTPCYIPPELANGQQVDHRSDIFSFGVCLFRLLNGIFPFFAEHPTAIIYQICKEPPPDFHPGTPGELRDLCLACLAKNPNERPAGFTEVGATLERMLATGFSRDLADTIDLDYCESPSGDDHRNPYLSRVMIKRPTDFIGREREIRKIYSRLDAPHPQSISIVGERRIGKSSLLNSIYNRANRKQYMSHDNDAIFVYLDFQSRADFTVPKFIEFLSSVFRFENRIAAEPTGQPNSLDWLHDTVRSLHESGRRIILLMDEFECITRNTSFDAAFFSFLRSLANSYRVAYVTSSCDELQNMCHNKDISDSPFFNIFSNLPLRPFTPAEARQLIIEPSEQKGITLAAHTQQLLDMAGCFPFYLQIACSCLFEFLAEDRYRDVDWKVVTRAFLDEVEPHFGFVWDQMDGPEKENLRRVALGQNISRKYEFVNEDLLRRGYLFDSEGQTALFSRCFREFILARNEGDQDKGFFSKLWNRGK
jgi:serine/threonine protein kinase